LKSIIHKLIFNLLDVSQKWSLRKYNGFKKVYVVDIDNTLTIYRGDGKIDHRNPDPRPNMVKFVKSIIARNEPVIFLSARNYRLMTITKNWLGQQEILSKTGDVFLVPNAEAKIPYLKYLLSKNVNVEYIDDLSYNHENNQVKFYQHVIDQVIELDIDYKGLDYIASI
jgi:hypothetical protein